MKTKFLASKIWGGQIKFAFALVIFISLTNHSICQTDPYTIVGESLWRNQSFGVSNHTFDIENYVIPENDFYPVSPEPTTGSCGTEYYTTDNLELYVGNLNSASNTLLIRPYSSNSASDYRNGVSTLDCYAIASHLNNATLFEERVPEDDAPYRYISADADYDNDVDWDDIYMIQDLLLQYRDDLERNSWEWVLKEEVEEADERFIEDPFSFVIDYNWPGNDGIIQSELSTNQIDGNNGNYFDFRTTKIGDIIGIASTGLSPAASFNTWMCGILDYFDTDEIESRSSLDIDHQSIRKGSILTYQVSLEASKDIYSIELPITFSSDIFEFFDLTFKNSFSANWNSTNHDRNIIVMDFSTNEKPLAIPNGILYEFKLKAKKDFHYSTNLVTWDQARNVEITNGKSVVPNLFPSLDLIEVKPPDFFVEVRQNDLTPIAVIESPVSQNINVQLINSNGINLGKNSIFVNVGPNYYTIDPEIIPGIYLFLAETLDQVAVAKFVKQ